MFLLKISLNAFAAEFPIFLFALSKRASISEKFFVSSFPVSDKTLLSSLDRNPETIFTQFEWEVEALRFKIFSSGSLKRCFDWANNLSMKCLYSFNFLYCRNFL